MAWWAFKSRNEHWRLFNKPDADVLNSKQKSGELVFKHTILNTEYTFDLQSMTQTTPSGNTTQIRLGPNPKVTSAPPPPSPPPIDTEDVKIEPEVPEEAQAPPPQPKRVRYGPGREPVPDCVEWVCISDPTIKIGPLTMMRFEHEWKQRTLEASVIFEGRNFALSARLGMLRGDNSFRVRRRLHPTPVEPGFEWQYRPVQTDDYRPFEKSIAEMLEAAVVHDIKHIHYDRDGELRQADLEKFCESCFTPQGEMNFMVIKRVRIQKVVPHDILWEVEGLLHQNDWSLCPDLLANWLEAVYERGLDHAEGQSGGEKLVVEKDGKEYLLHNKTLGTRQRLRRTVRPSEPGATPFPSYWDLNAPMDSSGKFSLNTLPTTDPEYQRVSSAFYATANSQLKIVNIKTYQNRNLWAQYHLNKQALDQQLTPTFPKGANEHWAFHGTKTQESIRNICVNGFLRDFNTAQGFGFGSYFARDASYSVDYAPPIGPNNIRTMFYVRILIGEPCKGSNGKKQPDKKPSGVLYDSMVNDVANPSIFVLSVASDSKAYPEFIIEFQ
eukprot:c18286_g1_i4.p1 GENE.c18286_g1_i4~~c18286_g1_i4.p1  ORF type:complete len:560 (+),score=80.63 c18286_g1_i4:25-1680(+)